jgi:hypothetical protein
VFILIVLFTLFSPKFARTHTLTIKILGRILIGLIGLTHWGATTMTDGICELRAIEKHQKCLQGNIYGSF